MTWAFKTAWKVEIHRAPDSDEDRPKAKITVPKMYMYMMPILTRSPRAILVGRFPSLVTQSGPSLNPNTCPINPNPEEPRLCRRSLRIFHPLRRPSSPSHPPRRLLMPSLNIIESAGTKTMVNLLHSLGRWYLFFHPVYNHGLFGPSRLAQVGAGMLSVLIETASENPPDKSKSVVAQVRPSTCTEKRGNIQNATTVLIHPLVN